MFILSTLKYHIDIIQQCKTLLSNNSFAKIWFKKKKSHKYTQLIVINFYWKHQALSTDIISTSWPTKEIARELQQQSFLFPTSCEIPATEPFLQFPHQPTQAERN